MFPVIPRLRGPYLRALAFVVIALPAFAQTAPPLQQMADAERAFAARARVAGWKQAFLEYFADTAVGFDGTGAGLAKDQIRSLPDPPKDAQLLWEPRFGDIAASGELGWLTGPSTSINPSRDNGVRGDLGYTWGRSGMGFYVRVWTRAADGAWKVALDVVQ